MLLYSELSPMLILIHAKRKCTCQNPQQQKINQYKDTPVARDILINKSAERRHFFKAISSEIYH